MYVMNAAIEAIDDQNEVIKIEHTSGSSCVDIDEHSGTIVLYTDLTYEQKHINNSLKTIYTVKKVPCTIYRNLKKIIVKRGTRMPWKYIRFAK